MSTTVTLRPGASLFLRPGPFALDHDAPLSELALPFELSGPVGAPVVLVQGGISADPHVAATAADPARGWWDAIVGPGRALDTRRFRVLSLDWLGRREEATVSSGDQARATALLLDELGIGALHACVGASYGGMVGLRLAELFPSCIARLVVISAGERAAPFATGWRALQRRVLALGARVGEEREATAIARALGMLSYRSPQELGERFVGERVPADDGDLGAAPFTFPVEQWLVRKGREFADRFDGSALARLSLAIDLHRADVTRIATPTTLIAADPDLLVPAAELAELAARFARPARFARIASRFGHDAFLKEIDALAPLLAAALAEATR